MSQEQIAGIILCVIGLVLNAKPTLVWKITENWKTEKSSAPSAKNVHTVPKKITAARKTALIRIKQIYMIDFGCRKVIFMNN